MTQSWPILVHYRFLVGACGRTRNFLRRIIGLGQEIEPGFPKNKLECWLLGETLYLWMALQVLAFLCFKVIMCSMRSTCKVRRCTRTSRNPSHYKAWLEINSSQISYLANDLCHWVRKSQLPYVDANAAFFNFMLMKRNRFVLQFKPDIFFEVFRI
jgi:hypothetical protein